MLTSSTTTLKKLHALIYNLHYIMQWYCFTSNPLWKMMTDLNVSMVQAQIEYFIYLTEHQVFFTINSTLNLIKHMYYLCKISEGMQTLCL